jgi:Flp pilus assembly protein TadG
MSAQFWGTDRPHSGQWPSGAAFAVTTGGRQGAVRVEYRVVADSSSFARKAVVPSSSPPSTERMRSGYITIIPWYIMVV